MKKLYPFLLAIILISCKDDIQKTDVLVVGNIPPNSVYNDTPKSIVLPKSELDTTIIDTLFLNLNPELSSDIAFIITQKFLHSIYKSSNPIKQRIDIITSDKIQFQLHPSFKDEAHYVKSSFIGDKISPEQNWVKNIDFFYTQIQGNFRIAPRQDEDYIPIMYESKYPGWIKIKMDLDNNWVLQKFQIVAFCIKQ